MLTIEGLAMAGLGPPGGVPAAQGGTPQVDFATLLAAATEAPAAIAPPGYGVPLMGGALDGQALPSPQIEVASTSPSTSALVELLTLPKPVPPGANASMPEGTPRPDRTSEATVSEEDHSTEELLAAALAASVALAPPHVPPPVTPLAVSSAAPPVIAISASAAEVATSEWSSAPREALPAADARASAVNVTGFGAGLAPAVAARAAESAATRVEPSATGATGTASENASAAPVPEAASDATAGRDATSGAALIEGGTNTLMPAGLPSDSPSAEAGDVSTSTPPAAASAQPRDASNSVATGTTDAPGIATMGRALASPVADRAQADAPAPPPDSAPEAPAPATNDAPVSTPVAVALEAAPVLEEDTTRATVVSPLDTAASPAGTTEAASSDAALVNDPAALGSVQRTDPPVAANSAAAPAVDSTDRAALQARLADSVLAAARTDSTVRLVLNPPELGHLEVRVERHEQGLRVELVTATADAADLIKQQLPALVSGLEARSVRVDQAEVRQAPPAGSTAFSLGSDARQAGADTSGSRRQWERPEWSEAARIAQESTAPRTNRPRNGLLDMVA
ncbi:MAG: flagellar hook-length control protein FliK [Dehalococcoidia bacterium]|nr:flagellar hook-length control protein FliK [Dehalococcoidia bacterium]